MPIIAKGMRFNSAYSLWLTSPQSHLLLMSQGDVPAFSWLLLSRLATFYLVPHPGQFAQNHFHNLAGLPLPHQFRIFYSGRFQASLFLRERFGVPLVRPPEITIPSNGPLIEVHGRFIGDVDWIPGGVIIPLGVSDDRVLVEKVVEEGDSENLG